MGQLPYWANFFGRTTYSFNKAKYIEGTLAGMVFAFLGACIFVNPVKALLGAAVGMFVESLPLPVDDNLAIPLISGSILTLIPSF